MTCKYAAPTTIVPRNEQKHVMQHLLNTQNISEHQNFFNNKCLKTRDSNTEHQ